MSGIVIAYDRSETGLKQVWNRSETLKTFKLRAFPLLQFVFLLDSSKLCCYLGKKKIIMMSVPAFLYCFMSQIALAAIGSPFGCYLFGLQWMQAECVLGAAFSGLPWLQLECVLGVCFSGPTTTITTTITTTTPPTTSSSSSRTTSVTINY